MIRVTNTFADADLLFNTATPPAAPKLEVHEWRELLKSALVDVCARMLIQREEVRCKLQLVRKTKKGFKRHYGNFESDNFKFKRSRHGR